VLTVSAILVTHAGKKRANANAGSLSAAASKKYGTKAVMLSTQYGHSSAATSWTNNLPPGPYFLSPSTGKVFQAYLLYSDVQGAFTQGIIATSDGNYTSLSAAVQVRHIPWILLHLLIHHRVPNR
jgi:hypothetical protein